MVKSEVSPGLGVPAPWWPLLLQLALRIPGRAASSAKPSAPPPAPRADGDPGPAEERLAAETPSAAGAAQPAAPWGASCWQRPGSARAFTLEERSWRQGLCVSPSGADCPWQRGLGQRLWGSSSAGRARLLVTPRPARQLDFCFS